MQSNIWDPLHYLQEDTDDKHALIKLNTPLESDAKLFKWLWRKASLKALVDGAVNEFYDQPELRTHYVPDLITGDFDSARPSVLQYYREQHVEIVNTPDQNETDFTKCLRTVGEKIKTHKLLVTAVFVHVTFAGRTDHVMANINTLFMATKFTDVPVYLISGDSISFLLPKGRHKVKINQCLKDAWCGLIPVGEPCECASSTGLKYNLDHHRMAFGDLISTSNAFDGSPEVTVETSAPLLFTMANGRL